VVLATVVRMPPPEGRIRAGRWLAGRRKALGLQQGALAHRLGISQQSLSSYETGRVWVPDDVAAKLAVLFGAAETVVRRELGLHVPGDVEASVDPIPLSAPEPEGEVIRLPPGLHLTTTQRRALKALIDAFVEQAVGARPGSPDFHYPGTPSVDIDISASAAAER
jgi:transcriptional regulator with XRE-family HTH domain